MSAAVSYEEYKASLSKLSADTDPTIETADTVEVLQAAQELANLSEINRATIAHWVVGNENIAYVLGLSLGMGRERLKNICRELFGTTSIALQAKRDPTGLVRRLDTEFDLVRILSKQLMREYTFGDVLVARARARSRGVDATKSGRNVEKEIEAIVHGLGLPYETGTTFAGKGQKTAPADLVIPTRNDAVIAVAAKGFDSTGSKLRDAVREIQEMAEVRLPKQFICAVVDGIGWHSRQADLKRLYTLWDNDEIDGLYTLSSLSRFRDDVAEQSRLRGYKTV
ncbi:DpnII family type II restriction endonuclease [Rhodococcoides kyotonense]|uniref:DpnII restriction endonuclease n=1 Tax=Rhodococcoides kyotonense TaxID=398843 RepID=A0A239INT7_9NOCA|nr:DpnII family type II restriction endonuclease [Rhodococcus kyotonensis]SNS95211.1 DpnII restriction endonuclease [Rhodococcus kyotonensis]